MLAAWVIVGFVFIGMLALFCLCCALFAYVAKDVCDGYRDLLKHARRHPRFGISVVFTLVTIAATACGLFRWLSGASLPGETWFLAVLALVAAIGAVCAIEFVAADFMENYSRRRQSHRTELIWEEPPSNDSNNA